MELKGGYIPFRGVMCGVTKSVDYLVMHYEFDKHLKG